MNPHKGADILIAEDNRNDVGGFEVLKAIRADPRTRTIPVVMTTSSHDETDVRTAYELGASRGALQRTAGNAINLWGPAGPSPRSGAAGSSPCSSTRIC
jgi:CheY-like chemotaxis protein